jgi:hypothetical protein
MSDRRARNRRVGLLLSALTLGLCLYSFLVIKTRGKLPEPEGLTKWQKIFRGL